MSQGTKGSLTGSVVEAGANEFCGTSALSSNSTLISRGTCSFEEKTANAVASRARGVMIYNNVAGSLGKLPTTGTVAVVWAARPNLTNSQLLSLLTSTAKDLGTAGQDNNFGHSLVNPARAITGQ